MTKDNAINVVFSSDNDYFVPTYVAIYSLLENYKGHQFINIFIFLSRKYPDAYCRIIDDLKTQFPEQRVSFRYIYMGERYTKAEISTDYIKEPSMYRLSIARELSEVNRCIYLDSDLLITGDISELFDVDLQGKPIAGVKDIMISDTYEKKRCELLAIPKQDQYINAGVLIMDLREIRKLSLDKKMEMMGRSGKKYPYNDQDIINSVFYDNILLLPPRFNSKPALFVHDYGYSKKYGLAEYRYAIEKPVIIHYASKIKPWIYRTSPKAELWWNYLEIIDLGSEQIIVENFIKGQRASIIESAKVIATPFLKKTGLFTPVRAIYRISKKALRSEGRH